MMNSLPMLVSLIETAIKEKTIDKMYGDFLEEAIKMGLSSYTLNVLIINAIKRIKNGNTDSNDGIMIPFIYRSDIIKPKKEIKKIIQEKVIYKRPKGYIALITGNIILLLVLAIFIGLFFLNGSLNNTKKELDHTRYELRTVETKLSDAKTKLSDAKTKLSDAKSKISDLNKNLERTESSLSDAQKECDNVKNELNKFKEEIGESIPILITDIKIANTDYDGNIETNYGNSIYSSNTMYLQPKIYYKGVKTGNNITLYVRLYTPSGLSTGNSSPNEYSFSSSMYVYYGSNTETLLGWGNSSRGHWSKGSYRFEIWYNNVCLKSKTFKIY